jgi:hypothetical protein
MLWCASTAAGAQPQQEAPKPKPPALVEAPPREAQSPPPDESTPTYKKYANVYDQLEMQGFSVALLLGEIHGVSTTDSVPEGAKKALTDLREFLPYKSYRLLDTQWIRCCAGPNVEGRLRGFEEQYYAFGISINSVAPTKMTAHFALTDAAEFAPGKKRIISNNFSMDTGETVVIGTSSLKGDKALVVLLTAVPRSPMSKTKKGSIK